MLSVEKSDTGGQGKRLSPGVGSIEGQTFPVREAQTTCLRFDLTPTSHAVPGPWSSSVQEPSVPVNHQESLPQTRAIVSVRPGDARSFLEESSPPSAARAVALAGSIQPRFLFYLRPGDARLFAMRALRLFNGPGIFNVLDRLAHPLSPLFAFPIKTRKRGNAVSVHSPVPFARLYAIAGCSTSGSTSRSICFCFS